MKVLGHYAETSNSQLPLFTSCPENHLGLSQVGYNLTALFINSAVEIFRAKGVAFACRKFKVQDLASPAEKSVGGEDLLPLLGLWNVHS